MIALYGGEVIRGKQNINSRLSAQSATGVVKIIRMGCGTIAIDATIGGDATAYINHSCEPDAFMQEVSGDKVMFFALRDIEAGEEITINYRDPDHPPVGGCRCGTERCGSSIRHR